MSGERPLQGYVSYVYIICIHVYISIVMFTCKHIYVQVNYS